MSKHKQKGKLVPIQFAEKEQMTLYFAYGSNLHKRQMQQRCPDSIPVTAASLPGWSLEFSGVLTVEPKKGASCLGALFLTSKADERNLDRYEGYPRMYDKVWSHVTIDGIRHRVYFYTLNQPYQIAPPSMGYLSCVAEGYKNFGLDMAHLIAAQNRAEDAQEARYGDLVPNEDEYTKMLLEDLDWRPGTRSERNLYAG